MTDWLHADDGFDADYDPHPRRTAKAIEIEIDRLLHQRPVGQRATNEAIAAHEREVQRLQRLFRQVSRRADAYDNPMSRLRGGIDSFGVNTRDLGGNRE